MEMKRALVVSYPPCSPHQECNTAVVMQLSACWAGGLLKHGL